MLIRQPLNKPDLPELRQSILGLILACPFDGTKPPDCQLCEIRQLSLRLRFEWVNSLTIEEAAGIWATHEKCLTRKECQQSK
jgi:hypothetical protein